MADQSTQSIIVDAPAADVMAVIADFPAYPQWVAAAKKVEVVEAGDDGRARRVHFVLDAGAVKDDYVLDYTWDGDRKVVLDPRQGPDAEAAGRLLHARRDRRRRPRSPTRSPSTSRSRCSA